MERREVPLSVKEGRWRGGRFHCLLKRGGGEEGGSTVC